VCPSPPIPVRIDKRQVLVYELHVTNFDSVPLTLKRLDVFANEESRGPAHLHLQVTDRNSVLQSQGVPFEFENFTYLGPGSDYELNQHVSVPWISSIPPADAVIQFEKER
jgi:hypothetical protein